MATAAAAINQAASPKPVDDSLWWGSFVLLFEQLDRAPLSDDLPDHLVKKLRSNRSWFLDSVARFKPPNETSRLALDSTEIIAGSNRLVIRPVLKEAALRICKCLSLDEVQSYILIVRASKFSISVVDVEGREFLHSVRLHYYLERQCLLKCIRRILVHALYASNGSAIRGEALQLVNNGLEKRLLSIFEDLLSTVFSVRDDAEFTVLWVEETLIEENLILDILFLLFYDNFSICSGGQWKTLCSLFKGMLCGPYDVGKLAVTVEAKNTFCHAKTQLLLILIETLDLENLLHMVHDEVPFREGFSAFSLSDIQEIDAEVSSLSELRIVESGPLVLAWGVFICLLSSLPESTTSMFMEIDHTGYVRQAFEVAPFRYSLDILCSDTLRESDGPVSGFLSIFRTLFSAFIASYELSLPTEDNYLNMILDNLCQIYRSEESLCVQFWDKDSFVDGPIRSLLYMLEKKYPLQTIEFIRFLSAVCEGSWAAQCTYNYLEKMNGITTLHEIPNDSVAVNIHDLIEIDYQMSVPGIEGHIIPNGTHGHVLKVIGDNVALVRWECPHSGILLLLFKLVQGLHSYNYEEVYHIVDLLCRMISSNKAVCLSLLHAEKSLAVAVSKELGQIEKDVRIDVVNIICTSMLSLIHDVSNISVVSNFFKMLAEFLNCAPSHVFELVLKSPVFATEMNGSSSGSWYLSSGLAKMFFAACEEERDCCLLTTSVVDFIIQVLEKGTEDSVLSALIVFFLQYVLVNHMHWKYKKYARWKATVKVLVLLKSCIRIIPVSCALGGIIQDILLYDTSIHNILLRIMCMATQSLEKLHSSHHLELKEIEDLHLVVSLALDIIHSILADLSEESFADQPTFVNMVLSSASKPMPFITAVASLVSFFHNSEIQRAASRVLSKICFIASRIQPVENANLVADAMQNSKLRGTIYCILDEKENQDDNLIVSMFNLLHSAACYQPSLLVSLILKDENPKTELNANGDTKSQLAASPVIQNSISKDTKLIDLIMQYVERSKDLFNSSPHLLLSVLDLLKAFWEGGLQYVDILERIRGTKNICEYLSACISSILDRSSFPVGSWNDDDSQHLSIRYHCQGTVLEIMACELFLQKRFQDEKPEKTTHSLDGQIGSSNMLDSEDIMKTWCDSSIIEALIMSYSSTGYGKDLVHQAKVAVCLFIVHLITKVSTGDMGSLSMSIVKKLHIIFAKLSQHPAFSALLLQYSLQGYSGGKKLANLVLNDLYYHLRGELEGREITSGPFQDLLRFLLSLEAFQNEHGKEKRSSLAVNDSFMFDISHIRRELGIDLWCYSGWKESKEIAEKMLVIIHNANLMMSIAASKLFALKALIAALSVYVGRNDEGKPKLLDRGMSDQLILSCIRYVCKTLQETVDSEIPHVNINEVFLQFLSAHAELLLTLTKILFEQRKCRRWFFPIVALLTKSSGSVIRILPDISPFSPTPNRAVKLLLMLLLTSLRFTYSEENMEDDEPDLEVNFFSEVSISSIEVLPVLCKFAENSEYSNLSVASLDLMLKGHLSPNIWFPILQKHLRLQLILQKLLMKDASISAHVIFNFCLTLARTKDGAKMLHLADISSFLKALLGQLNVDDPLFSDGSGFTSVSQGKHVHLWRLGLAIMTSVIHCIGDDYYMDTVDNSIHLLLEKAYVISFSLSAPNITVDDQRKNRGILQKSKISLGALNLTEHALIVICELAKHQAFWSMGMKEIGSGLNEMIIHLLAFISKGTLRSGESSHCNLPFECRPTVKEEVEFDEIPSLMKSKKGWYSFSVCSMRNTTSSAKKHAGLPLVNKDQAKEDSDLVQQTLFTDMVATQIYKIAFLILKFLCMQTKTAVKRAEEVAFIDRAHFPELPMPEILHGLQAQATAIITEMCEGNRSKCLSVETENVCLLLLQILENSLYLEFCVSQSCGIRPVLGRIEDFSKEIKAMMHAAEQHPKLKPLLRSLKHIIALQYPGLLHH